LPTLLKQVTAAVGGLDLVADRVRQGHLDHLARKIRALGRPVPEGRTEPVRGELTPVHPLENGQHRHVRERLPFPAAGKDEVALTDLLHLLENGRRCGGEWHPVFAPCFHPRRRHDPELVVEINFIPGSVDHLAGARRGQDKKLERASRDAFLVPQCRDEIRHLVGGQGGMVLDLWTLLRAGSSSSR